MFEVLLTANATFGNYWITAQPQYREGSPNGFAILRYEGANATQLPTESTPQPEAVAPWTPEQAAKVSPTLCAILIFSSANVAEHHALHVLKCTIG